MVEDKKTPKTRPEKIKRLPPGVSNPVDVHVGSRLKLRRTLSGMSQEALGDQVGLTFQQIQKYERGTNRVGASRLWEFSKILTVPVSFFFDDMPKGLDTHEERFATGMKMDTTGITNDDPLARREILELVRAYDNIEDKKSQKRLFELTKAMGKADFSDE